MTLRIATRGSALALAQANNVAEQLRAAHPDLDDPRSIQLVIIQTEGDQNTKTHLSDIGGKGLFIKEIERALLEGKADIAVHSMKDMPAQLSSSFAIGAILEREDPRDVWISASIPSIKKLPKEATVGTASPRRESILKSHHTSAKLQLLRGNVPTRLERTQKGEFDGTILAAAGLHRLGLRQHITEYIDTEWMLPAAAQGAVGIETLSTRYDELSPLLAPLHHAPTAACVQAERALLAGLGADCTTPIAAHATQQDNGTLRLRAQLYHGFGKLVAQCDETIKQTEDAYAIGQKFRKKAPSDLPLLRRET